MRRRLLPVIAVPALLLAGATGCSAQDSAEACTPALKPGALSDAVRVSGGFGEEPKVVVPDDVQAKVSQRTAVISAEDREKVAGENGIVMANVALFDGASGELLHRSGEFDADRASRYVLLDRDPIGAGLECSAPGDRTLVVLSPDESEQLAPTMGVELAPGAPLIAVVDTVGVGETSARGEEKGLPAGFPAVVTDEQGNPGVVLPPNGFPEDMRTALRIEGDGPEVEADDTVLVHALGIDGEGETFADTRENGSPIPIFDEKTAPQDGYDFRDRITGVPVGSQLVIMRGGEQPHVLVLDILGVA